MRALDQNQMSNPSHFTETSDIFLLPDIAWFENIKSIGWREDVIRSFALFHKEPHRVCIAYSISVLLKQEMKTHQAETDPVDRESTKQLQELLKNDDYITAIEANIWPDP